MDLYLLTVTQDNNTSLTQSPYFMLFVSLCSGVFASTITILFTRREAKKKLIIDITTQELFPKLYVPLIAEYQRVTDIEIRGGSATLQTKELEKVIFENVLIIKLAPKSIQNKINTIYSLCKSIGSKKDYDEKHVRIREGLLDLKKEINTIFEGYLR